MIRQKTPIEKAATAGRIASRVGVIVGKGAGMVYGCGVALLLVMTGAIDIKQALQPLIDKEEAFSPWTGKTFIPELPAGDCLYTDPEQVINITFSGSNTFLSLEMLKAILPVIESGGINMNESAGTLPAFRTASCAVVDKDSPHVFSTRQAALDSLADEFATIDKKINALDEEFLRGENVRWSVEKIDRSPHP